MRVNLGSNIITDCDAALVVNGIEVFRLRNREADGRLICDFDLRNEKGDRIASVAKNNVVYAAEGYRYYDLLRESNVQDSSGNFIARVQEISIGEIKLTGDFWINGHHVLVTEDSLVSGGVTMSGNTIKGFGKAISIEPHNFSIGIR